MRGDMTGGEDRMGKTSVRMVLNMLKADDDGGSSEDCGDNVGSTKIVMMMLML